MKTAVEYRQTLEDVHNTHIALRRLNPMLWRSLWLCESKNRRYLIKSILENIECCIGMKNIPRTKGRRKTSLLERVSLVFDSLYEIYETDVYNFSSIFSYTFTAIRTFVDVLGLCPQQSHSYKETRFYTTRTAGSFRAVLPPS